MKKYIQKIREKYSVFLILILLVTSFSFGYLIKKSPVTEKAVEHSSDAHKGHSAMKHMRHITLSDTAQKLASIQVMPVERKFVTAEISMFGKIDYDETKLAYITARVPGRLDRLYVNYAGISVRKGDHLVYLYSPELLTAQEELIQALKRVRTKNKEYHPQIWSGADSTSCCHNPDQAMASAWSGKGFCEKHSLCGGLNRRAFGFLLSFSTLLRYTASVVPYP